MPRRVTNRRTLAEFARLLREDVIRLSYRARIGHVGSALSMVELLAVLYGEILRIDPHTPEDPNRDRFLLSKGHACVALYAALCRKGFFGQDLLETYCLNGGRLAGHPEVGAAPGIEMTSGSLGHGLSQGLGMAIAARSDKSPARVFALLSDGECDEGATWEAALAAGHFGVDNLIAIVDYNHMQAMGPVEEVMALEPLAAKWRAFGWATREVDGHNLGSLLSSFHRLPFRAGRPSAVIAHTVAGNGISFMQGRLEWHYLNPTAEQAEAALNELRPLHQVSRSLPQARMNR